MYLWVMNCVKARGWDIASVVKNLPSDKEEGVKALPFPEGDGKRKIWSAYKHGMNDLA